MSQTEKLLHIFEAKDWLGGVNAPSEAGSYKHSEDIHRFPSFYLQVLYKPCPTFDGSTWRVNALIINIRQGFSSYSLENVYDIVRQNQMSIILHSLTAIQSGYNTTAQSMDVFWHCPLKVHLREDRPPTLELSIRTISRARGSSQCIELSWRHIWK